MLLRLFLVFTIVPVIEIWLLIQVGRVIGPLPTVAVLLAISMAGALLTRSQGFRTLATIRDELAMGRIPGDHFMNGALILAGGILLFTPGFFTDFVGLFFLIPATRRILKRWLGNWLERKFRQGTVIVRCR